MPGRVGTKRKSRLLKEVIRPAAPSTAPLRRAPAGRTGANRKTQTRRLAGRTGTKRKKAPPRRAPAGRPGTKRKKVQGFSDASDKLASESIKYLAKADPAKLERLVASQGVRSRISRGGAKVPNTTIRKRVTNKTRSHMALIRDLGVD